MPASDVERAAMRRALALAAEGPRGVNPQVGAVVLSPAGDVLAEGRHRGAGTPHAEIDALSQLDPDAARGATVVVTLEPCDHTGRTGPCSLALAGAGVARVVYALDDPGAHSGGGAERLRGAGVDVEGGVETNAAYDLLRDWLRAQRLGRPFITVKWAQSIDGRVAAADGTSRWITGPHARRNVHLARSGYDAIVVGTGTVLADDPALTARNHAGDLYQRQPVPVVIGSREVPPDAAVRRHPHAPLFFADPATATAALHERGLQRVYVEGGPTLATSFVRAGLYDELAVDIAPMLIGGDRLAVGDIGVGTLPDAPRFTLAGVKSSGDDVHVDLRRRDSTAWDPDWDGVI